MGGGLRWPAPPSTPRGLRAPSGGSAQGRPFVYRAFQSSALTLWVVWRYDMPEKVANEATGTTGRPVDRSIASEPASMPIISTW